MLRLHRIIMITRLRGEFLDAPRKGRFLTLHFLEFLKGIQVESESLPVLSGQLFLDSPRIAGEKVHQVPTQRQLPFELLRRSNRGSEKLNKSLAWRRLEGNRHSRLVG